MQRCDTEILLLLYPASFCACSFSLCCRLQTSKPATVSFTPSSSRCVCVRLCVAWQVWKADRRAPQMGFNCVQPWWQMPAEENVSLLSGQTLKTEAPASLTALSFSFSSNFLFPVNPACTLSLFLSLSVFVLLCLCYFSFSSPLLSRCLPLCLLLLSFMHC